MSSLSPSVRLAILFGLGFGARLALMSRLEVTNVYTIGLAIYLYIYDSAMQDESTWR